MTRNSSFVTLFFRILIALAVAATFHGCRDSRDNLHPYGWEPTGGGFDSLMLVAERLYINRAEADSINAVITRMRNIANSKEGNMLTDSRTTYWEGRLALYRGDIDGGTALMGKALAMTDSARNPYDHHRILWNLDMEYHAPTIERYRYLLEELDFFMDSGDLPISADLCMEIGTFLDDLGDTDNGIPYLEMADSLFNLAGMSNITANNRINHANALTVKGDKKMAEILLRGMLADTVTPIDSSTRDIVLGNLYSLTGDTAALREAYDLVKGNPILDEAKCMYENFLTREAMKNGDIATAGYYHRLASSHLQSTGRPDVIIEYHRLRQKLFAIEGKMDSAYHYLAIAAEMSDSINTSDKDIEIRNANLSHRIAEMKLHADIERRQSTIVYLAVTFGLLLLLLASGVLLYRRTQRQKLERARALLQQERSNRRIMAMELVMKEKDKLFDKVGSEMDVMAENGEISLTAASKIGSSLKAHSGLKAERDNFIETFEKLSPSFVDNLKKDYPGLTDTDTRLAGFIALGLDNKHIARVMGIRPESVKQARWRLRSKMGLPSGSSLEEKLREFTSDNP